MSVTIISPSYIRIDSESIREALGFIPTNTQIKLPADDTYKSGNVDITLESLKLSNVENKSASQILNEITSTLIISKLGFTPQDESAAFSGNYADLNEIPETFNTTWEKVANKPSSYPTKWADIADAPEIPDDSSAAISGIQATIKEIQNVLGDKADKDGLFDGKYTSLTELPKSFPTTWEQVENRPTIPADQSAAVSNLQDSVTSLTSQLSGKLDSNSFTWANLGGKPNLFDGKYTSLTDTPSTFPSNWANVADKPSVYPTNWANVTDKPNFFSGSYKDLTDKPTTTSSTGTLATGTWSGSGPYTYVLAVSGLTTDAEVDVYPADTMSNDDLLKVQAYGIFVSAASTTGITLKATKKPEINIPIKIEVKQ